MPARDTGREAAWTLSTGWVDGGRSSLSKEKAREMMSAVGATAKNLGLVTVVHGSSEICVWMVWAIGELWVSGYGLVHGGNGV
ncbi:hypothetical protein M0R45_034918 [Rubus argutus]|uniref:Fructose-bisphosphate aldolase n=1 Tax=Rubus argutus TaxID=59490 RepID=A0AAW1VVR3_RUBAR